MLLLWSLISHNNALFYTSITSLCMSSGRAKLPVQESEKGGGTRALSCSMKSFYSWEEADQLHWLLLSQKIKLTQFFPSCNCICHTSSALWSFLSSKKAITAFVMSLQLQRCLWKQVYSHLYIYPTSTVRAEDKQPWKQPSPRHRE